MEKDLQDNGFKSLNGEAIAAKGVMAMLKNLGEPKTISTSPASKIYVLGKDLTIDAECGHDILFVGAVDKNFGGYCNINKSVKASVCVLVVGEAHKFTVNIPEGVTVDKLFTVPGVVVNNRGSIPGGVHTDIKDFYNFEKLVSTLQGKYGEVASEVTAAILGVKGGKK